MTRSSYVAFRIERGLPRHERILPSSRVRSLLRAGGTKRTPHLAAGVPAGVERRLLEVDVVVVPSGHACTGRTKTLPDNSAVSRPGIGPGRRPSVSNAPHTGGVAPRAVREVTSRRSALTLESGPSDVSVPGLSGTSTYTSSASAPAAATPSSRDVCPPSTRPPRARRPGVVTCRRGQSRLGRPATAIGQLHRPQVLRRADET